MNLLDPWYRVIVPQDGYSFADMWQIIVVLFVLTITHLLFRSKAKATAEGRYRPSVWLLEHRGFLLFWMGITSIELISHFLIGWETPVFNLFAFLGGAWIIIGLATSLLKERFWANSVASVCYFATAFGVFALLGPSFSFLEDLAFNMGTVRLTVWGLISGVTAFIFTLWVSLAIARLLESQIHKVPRLSPSLRVLLIKILRIVFIVAATFIAISSMGVDLSALTVLGGAVGLGLGFGLQKVVSNFVSGIILLTDNSIKPGDVIEIDGTYGWINNLRARYASIITRDGKEHLIPNEDLITQRVVNWSYTDNLVRLKAPIGVAYKEDPHRCIKLVVEAASSVERVLESPKPICLLKGFGDSSVDFELRFWIRDPSNGVSNVTSQVLLKVWDSFKENNVEIPFPQRDLHLRSAEPLPVTRTNPNPD